jgi:hypothetical protein
MNLVLKDMAELRARVEALEKALEATDEIMRQTISVALASMDLEKLAAEVQS